MSHFNFRGSRMAHTVEPGYSGGGKSLNLFRYIERSVISIIALTLTTTESTICYLSNRLLVILLSYLNVV